MSIFLSFFEVLCCVIFLRKVHKRNFFFSKLAVIIAVYLLISYCMGYFRLNWMIQISIKYIMMACLVVITTDSKLADGLYIASWGVSVQMLLFNTAQLVELVLNAMNMHANMFVAVAVVFLAGLLWFYQFLPAALIKEDDYAITRKQALITILIILPFHVFNNVLMSSQGYAYSLHAEIAMCCVFSCVCSMFVLYQQRITYLSDEKISEINFINQMLRERQNQYQLAKENIALINQKSHDLKNQVLLLKNSQDESIKNRYIKELSKNIQIYDSVFHTGNEVFDTLLTEKSLLCEKNHITIKCIVDGEQLGFMDPIDLYALFGNALDNAIESVLQLKEEERRIINLNVRREQEMLICSIENYIDWKLEFVDGLPKTTKENEEYHGFGLKSMQYTVKKYQGYMTVNVENQIFVVRFLFPKTSI